MALFDWNNDGEKNWQDNMIEHQIYINSTSKKDESSYTPSSGGGMSSFGAIISVVGGLLVQALLYVSLDINVSDVPTFVIIILWIVFSTIIAIVAEIFGL